MDVPGRAAGEPTLAARLPVEEVWEALRSRPTGLTEEEAGGRLSSIGPNTLAAPPRRHTVRRLAANFVHVMAVLLWVGGGVALVAGLPQLAVAIWTVNVINGLFSFWQEHKAERATEALRRLLPSFATVLRQGETKRVAAEELVPGDVVLLAEGDRVSADARLVDEAGLRLDQSTLSGESRPVRKTAEPVTVSGRSVASLANLVFAGTSVAAGRGKAVVLATGSSTQFGRVASLTEGMVEPPSPLQVEMRRLSYVVSAVAISVGLAFFGLAMSLGDLSPARGFVFALGMIVAFVPEGLLPTVTLALAMGTQRMARRHALVKRLSAVETLGSTSVICTDKTGTLTQNEMTVRYVATGEDVYELTGVGYEPAGDILRRGERVEGPPPPDLVDLLLAGTLASNARLLPPDAEDAGRRVVGDPTEAAILVAAAKAGVHRDEAVRRWPRYAELPFDSRRKRMSTVDGSQSRWALHVKGAPNELLARCATVRLSGGPIPLEQGTRERFTALVERFGGDGLRVLAVARRALEAPPAEPDAEILERGLELLGLVAMFDPPRAEVAAAVRTCRRAGIRVIMVTGDYGLTAETIGRRIGLLGEAPVRVVNGDDLDVMDDGEVREALQGDVVFARATPEHKLRVVAALQGMGHVVAVTGDGVNDAPALKRADIGVAMGLGGTDVAKEAADMILLDDNFASIVSAVEEGRAVYANIRKFTTYILTSNTPEAVPFVVFAFSGGRIPIALDVMHILAVDLGTDLVPALALGAEPVGPGVMDGPPRARNEHVIDRRLLARAYLWLGPIQATFVMAAFFAQYWWSGYPGRFLDLPATGTLYRSAAAMALAAVVATQIGNLFAQRSERLSLRRVGIGGNRMLWWGIASEIAVILAVVYVPALNSAVGTAPFAAQGWAWLLLGIPLLPMVDELRKLVVRRSGARERRSS